LRTSEDTFRLGSPTCLATLPVSGSMRSGLCSERTTLGHRTEEIDSSFWPTAKSSTGDYSYSGGDPTKPILNPEGAAKLWPTPMVPNGGRRNPPGTSDTGAAPDGRKKQVDLAEIVRRWATPDASGMAGRNRSDSPGASLRPQLGLQARLMATAGEPGSQKAVLNPFFVEALMGLPPSWTVRSASRP